jgi:hypothetical protein
LSSHRIPSYLTQGPDGKRPRPPVSTSEQDLPLGELGWQDFERLCLRLASRDGKPEHVQQFGTTGQAQAGIDIYSRATDGSYVAYQCKRQAMLRPADLRSAVARFLAGEWARKSTRFVLCTSASTRPTELVAEIERLAGTLRSRGILFEVWDAQRLSLLLKAAPDLVLDFFGPEWHARFVPETPDVLEVRALVVIKAVDGDQQERVLVYRNPLWDCLLVPSLSLHGRQLRERDDPYLCMALERALGLPRTDVEVERISGASHESRKWSYSRERHTRYRFLYFGAVLGLSATELRRPSFRVGGTNFEWVRQPDLPKTTNAHRNADVWRYMAGAGAPLLDRVRISFPLLPQRDATSG